MAGDTKHDGHLAQVYGAKTVEDVAAGYDSWSADYDTDMAMNGYQHPSVATALIARHVPPGTMPILDAGAGTGLCGQWLGLLGYPHVEALDISEGMLTRARQRGVYKGFHHCMLGGDLPFGDGHFGAILSSGVFTTGHVGASALPELARITAKSGKLVLTIKVAVWESEMEGAIAGSSALTLVEQTPAYLSMPGDPATTPSLAVVLERV